MSKIIYRPSPRAQISHELRIPISKIMGILYFLNTTNLTHQQKEHLNFIQLAADRLLTVQGEIDRFLIQKKPRRYYYEPKNNLHAANSSG